MNRPRPAAPPDRPPAPLSRLAVASLACSAVVCLPPASLLGIALAVVALLRLANATVPMRGRELALAALFLGAVGLIGQTFAIQWFDDVYRTGQREAMVADLERILEATMRGDAGAVRQHWSAAVERPTVERIDDFGAAARDRYGGFRSVSIVRERPGGSLAAPTVELALTVTFERRTLVGAATFGLLPSRSLSRPQVRLRSIEIDDGEHGSLRLP